MTFAAGVESDFTGKAFGAAFNLSIPDKSRAKQSGVGHFASADQQQAPSFTRQIPTGRHAKKPAKGEHGVPLAEQ